MRIITFIQSFANPFLDDFFHFVTVLGEEYIYIGTLAIVFWCIDKRYGYQLSFAFLFSAVLNGVAKSIVRRPRPIGMEDIRSLHVETATGYSFPSGHTQNITSFWISLVKQLRRTWVYATGCFLILLMGVSRLYLGLHWPTDVLGGVALGAVSVLFADFVFEYAARRRSAWIHLLLLIPVLVAAYIWHDSANLVKTAGIFCGFLIGYLIESRLIRFDTKASLMKQIVKIILGILIVLALKEGLKLLLPQAPIFDFLSHLIFGLWVTVGAPIVFCALRLSVAKENKLS